MEGLLTLGSNGIHNRFVELEGPRGSSQLRYMPTCSPGSAHIIEATMAFHS